MNTCYIVLGPYRSGTSLTAKTLSNLGVNFGPKSELYDASDFNPDGYYQRPDVSKANTNFFKINDGNELEPPSPQTLVKNSHLIDYKKENLYWSTGSFAWGLKDPRFCFSLSAWVSRGLLPNTSLKIIYIQRSIEAASKSCSMHYDLGPICGHSEKAAASMIYRYIESANWNIHNLRAEHIRIDYDHFVRNPCETVAKLADFVGTTDQSKIDFACRRVKYGKSVYRT